MDVASNYCQIIFLQINGCKLGERCLFKKR